MKAIHCIAYGKYIKKKAKWRGEFIVSIDPVYYGLLQRIYLYVSQWKSLKVMRWGYFGLFSLTYWSLKDWTLVFLSLQIILYSKNTLLSPRSTKFKLADQWCFWLCTNLKISKIHLCSCIRQNSLYACKGILVLSH
jgi:hypothetical protein